MPSGRIAIRLMNPIVELEAQRSQVKARELCEAASGPLMLPTTSRALSTIIISISYLVPQKARNAPR